MFIEEAFIVADCPNDNTIKRFSRFRRIGIVDRKDMVFGASPFTDFEKDVGSSVLYQLNQFVTQCDL